MTNERPSTITELGRVLQTRSSLLLAVFAVAFCVGTALTLLWPLPRAAIQHNQKTTLYDFVSRPAQRWLLLQQFVPLQQQLKETPANGTSDGLEAERHPPPARQLTALAFIGVLAGLALLLARERRRRRPPPPVHPFAALPEGQANLVMALDRLQQREQQLLAETIVPGRAPRAAPLAGINTLTLLRHTRRRQRAGPAE